MGFFGSLQLASRHAQTRIRITSLAAYRTWWKYAAWSRRWSAMETQRIARLERAVTQLRLIAIATTLAAIAAGVTAVIGLREPTELRLGAMRLDADGLSFRDGVHHTVIDARGLRVSDGTSGAGVGRKQIYVKDGTTMLFVVADGQRGTVAIEQPAGRAMMEVRAGGPSLHLTGPRGAVLQVPPP
jgi:hypothetical protein